MQDTSRSPRRFTKERVIDLVAIPAYLAPLALLTWFVLRFGVNVPVMDQWVLPVFFQKIKSGQVRFHDFFAQHAEHRIVFPKMIWAGLAFATNWNIKYELCVIVIFALTVFWAILKIAVNQRENDGVVLYHSSIFLTSLIVFSLIQFDNWLSGFQIPFMMTQTCLALAVLSATTPSMPAVRRFTLAAILCLVNTFTCAQGLFSWIALIPCIAIIFETWRGSLKAVAIWILLFVLSGAIYFIGLDATLRAGPNDRFYAFTHPIDGITYCLAILGAPYSRGFPIQPIKLAPPIGLIMVLAFLFFTCYAIWTRRIKIYAPWLAIGLSALLFSVILAVGRVAVAGVSNAVYVSRYTTAAIFLLIGLIQMARLFCRNHRLARPIYYLAACGLVGAVSIGSISAIIEARTQYSQREQGRLLIEILPFIDERTDASVDSCLRFVFPQVYFPDEGLTGPPRKQVEILEQLGFRHILREVPFIETPPQEFGSLTQLTTSSGAPVVSRSGYVRVFGGVAPQDTESTPKLVLISYGDQKTFIAAGLPMLSSNNSLSRSWDVQFPAEFLPDGESVIKAWAYDSNGKRFAKLADFAGEQRIRVQN